MIRSNELRPLGKKCENNSFINLFSLELSSLPEPVVTAPRINKRYMFIAVYISTSLQSVVCLMCSYIVLKMHRLVACKKINQDAFVGNYFLPLNTEQLP